MAVTAATNAVTVVEQLGPNRDGEQRRYTVAAGTDIAKGSVLKFADDRLATQSTGTGDMFAGIAAMDKEGDDPSTSISCWTNGIYEFVASGSITAGNNVQTATDAGANKVVVTGDVATTSAIIVGYAYNSASAGETVRVRVNI